MDFAIPADDRLKITENEKRDKYLDFSREQKTTVEHEGDGDTHCNWSTWNNPQNLRKGTGRWAETIQTKALLRSARILRRVLETWWGLAVT